MSLKSVRKKNEDERTGGTEAEREGEEERVRVGGSRIKRSKAGRSSRAREKNWMLKGDERNRERRGNEEKKTREWKNVYLSEREPTDR